jgi:Fanconi anemia group M protein
MDFLIGISPREYQNKIFETCIKKNCLVVLPTGLGKTLIALMLTIERMKQFPGEKVVFLAPTKPLAEQHLNYFKKHLPELFGQMELFTGEVNAKKRKKLWEISDIIFSTPQCVANDLKNALYNLREVCLLVEDEAHRCMKNYDYNFIARNYIEHSKNPRILGLTASPGSDFSKIKEICNNLSIEEVETRTRDSSDVKEYLQKLNFESVKLDFPPEFLEIKLLIKKIYDKKVEELKNRKLLWGVANKKTLLDLQQKIMHMISMGNRNFNVLAGASACAIAVKLQHAIELLETQTLYSLQQYFFTLFEQASNNKSKAIQQLIKKEEFNKSYILLNELISKKIEHPKLLKLKEITDFEISKNEKTKILIFTQYRDTAARICKEINLNKGVRAKVFVGQTKKTTRGKDKQESGLSQKEQQALIREFSSGETNCLVATSIGEEGLDLPEISTVIFYEPVPSAIRTIQRRGRTARLFPGKLIILITKTTRDEVYYWASFQKEKKMHRVIDELKGNFQLVKGDGPGKNLGSSCKEENQKTLS